MSKTAGSPPSGFGGPGIAAGKKSCGAQLYVETESTYKLQLSSGTVYQAFTARNGLVVNIPKPCKFPRPIAIAVAAFVEKFFDALPLVL